MTTALTKIDEFRQRLAHKDVHQQILNYFGGDEEITRKFESSVIHSVKKTPKLLECDQASLFDAFITCADLKLFPSSAGGEAFVLPYNSSKTGMHAQFQLGYQGLITLFFRAGVEAIDAQIVYEHDTFHYQQGLHAILDHIPAPFGKPRGKAIAVYAIAQMNGGKKIFKVMSEAEVMEIKKMSKSANSSFSPWTSNDPELWMWKKTCIKQLGKLLPKNETLNRAIDRDNQDSIVSELPDRRSIDTKELKKGAPTMGSLLTKKDPHEKGKKDAPQTALDFGVAGHSAEGEGQ